MSFRHHGGPVHVFAQNPAVRYGEAQSEPTDKNRSDRYGEVQGGPARRLSFHIILFSVVVMLLQGEELRERHNTAE